MGGRLTLCSCIQPVKIFTLLLLFVASTSCTGQGSIGGTYVWIDVPLDGITLPDVQPVNIEGHAASPGGASRVDIWVNGQLLRTIDSLSGDGDLARFQTVWTPEGPGEYTIQAVAFGADKAMSEPDSAIVSLGEPVVLQPDLALISVEAVVAGDKGGIPFCNTRLIYTNAGASPVPADFSIQFSFDGTPQQTTLVAGGLAPGANAEVIFVYQFVDMHYIGINLDAANVIIESDESNNAFAEARQCGALPTEAPMTPTIPPVDAIPTVPPPEATVTPTLPPVAAVQFWAEPARIQAGGCTTIRWHVENARTAIFGGIEQPFDGSYKECLCSDQRYSLRVVKLDGSEEKYQVDVDVTGACITPTPEDNTPPPAPTPAVPDNGLTLSCRGAQTLVWLPVDDPSGIDEYQVQAQRHAGDNNWANASGSPFDDIEGKSVEIPVECGWYYQWRVRAVDGKDNVGDWSDWWQFTITLE